MGRAAAAVGADGFPTPEAGAMWLSLLLLAALLLAVLGQVYKWLFAGSSPNPFSEDVKRPPAPLVTDKEARKKVLKQGQLEGSPGSEAAPALPCGLVFLFPQGQPLRDPGVSFPRFKCGEGFVAGGGACFSVHIHHLREPSPPQTCGIVVSRRGH